MSDLTPLGDLHFEGQQVLFNLIALVLQSMFYGVHIILIPVALHLLMKREQRLRPNAYHFCAMLLPFVLSSAYWAVQFAAELVRVQVFMLESTRRHASDHDVISFAPLFNAIILINYLISDGIVVWRAWALCRDNYRRALLVPIFLMAVTTLTVFSTICVRIIIIGDGAAKSSTSPLNHELTKVINVLQVANLVFSLLTNISATSIVSHMAWRHRQLIRAGLQNMPNRGTRVERVLVLLIESGFLYCISAITVLAFTLIKLPHGTLGDIYTPVNVQIAGIYPTIVIVLVGLQRTMDHTTLFHSVHGHFSAVSPRGTEVAPASIQFARDETLDLGDLNVEDKDPFARKAGMDVDVDVRELTSYKSDGDGDAYAV